MAADQTPGEARLVERYLSLLDEVTSCGAALHRGDWAALASAADSLSRRAVQLSAAVERQDPKAPPRLETVLGAVTAHGSGIARVLHPAPPAPPTPPPAGAPRRSAAPVTNPFAVPTPPAPPTPPAGAAGANRR
jgi:hypothetical protein